MAPQPMTTTGTLVGIKNSWSLIAFAKSHGTMKVTSELKNSKTGDTFRSCAFIKDGVVTMVGFASKLGELSAKEIAAQKDSLQVVELESGSLKLCKAGADSWETVDLGL